jgi:hypothetical protein
MGGALGGESPSYKSKLISIVLKATIELTLTER